MDLEKRLAISLNKQEGTKPKRNSALGSLLVKLPGTLEVSIERLIRKYGPYHLHRHCILLEHRIVKLLDGHLPAIHQFLFQCVELESACHIRQLVSVSVSFDLSGRTTKRKIRDS